MEYAKIIVKSDYEKRGDLVLRTYIRALKAIKPISDRLLDGDNAFIYGVIDDKGLFHEVFTGEVIGYSDYISVDEDEMILACIRNNEEKELLKAINLKTLFNYDKNLGFEISTMEDLAKDRAIEFTAYNNFLSPVNPYSRLSNGEVEDCNNFLRKIEKRKSLKKSNYVPEKDEYEVSSYQPRPNNEVDYEYLVFEVPKTRRK